MSSKALEMSFWSVYNKFKLNFYQKIFSRFETREASLTAVETFCVEVINAMDSPTINEFAQFVQISQANATYKVQSLIKKGYVTKERSEKDKREFILQTTDKYKNYTDVSTKYVEEVMRRLRERFPPEDITKFEEMINVMGNELMTEVNINSF